LDSSEYVGAKSETPNHAFALYSRLARFVQESGDAFTE
jgi:hypothetical protein